LCERAATVYYEDLPGDKIGFGEKRHGLRDIASVSGSGAAAHGRT